MHIGEFTAKETLHKCDNSDCENNIIYNSQELIKLVAPGCNYGYDLIDYIGESMFIRHMQSTEIRQTLLIRNNISISISGIEYLAKKFIIYLSVIHEHYNMEIVETMDSNGGYILHLDALGGNKGGERVISGIDSITDFVLENAKIPSENSISIIPFLEKIKKNFGCPLRIVQDMGKGIMKAVETVFPETEILICHFHFLRDIGKDLLETGYDIIRKRLRHFGFLILLRNLSKELNAVSENPGDINRFYEARMCSSQINVQNHTETAILLYTLIEWILDWKHESAGYGFPFDRPHYDLAMRVKNAFTILENITNIEDNQTQESITLLKIFKRLKGILKEITEDKELNNAVSEIEQDIQIFDSFRNAMRIAPKDGSNGLNDQGNEDIKTIEASVNKFISEIKLNTAFAESKKGISFLKQINKYRSKLFSDPITVCTPNGTKIIQPQRTNNIMEQMFRDFTRDNKRKTGNNSVGRTIRSMIKDTPLIRNLKNKEYRKLILENKQNLAEVFAEANPSVIRKKMREHGIYNEKIPKKIKRLLKEEKILDMLSNIKVND